MDGGLDKIRRSEEVRMEDNALRVQHGAQLCQCLFNPLCHQEGVRPVLGRNHQDYAGVPHDGGSTDGWLWGFNHSGYISQRHAHAVLMHQDSRSQLVWSEGLPLGLEDEALIGGIDDARAPDTRGL